MNFYALEEEAKRLTVFLVLIHNVFSAVVLFGNPGGSVKEQTPADYGEGLSKAGFAVLTFDSCHQGESGGEPRLLDNLYERSEDIKCGVDFLTTLLYIDRGGIGAIGQCAGSGFAIFATLTDRRIKAVCGLCCTNPGATTRQGWDGKRTVEEDIKTLDKIAEQRTAEAHGEPVKYVHYVPEKEEINKDTYPDMIAGNQFYREEAKHPNSPNLFRFTGMANRMTFDAYEYIPEYLDRPLLVINGSEAGSLWQSERAYELSNPMKIPKFFIPAVVLALFLAGCSSLWQSSPLLRNMICPVRRLFHFVPTAQADLLQACRI